MIQILVLADRYLPGYKTGGPTRSLANLIESLGAEFSFKVVTRDRDYGDDAPYPDLPTNSWHPVGKAQVQYLSPDRLSGPHLLRILLHTDHDLLYLPSFFSPVFTIQILAMRRLGLALPVPIIVGPRGEFSPSALQLKRTKKRLYLAAAKSLGLYRAVLWQASSHYEEEDIRRWFGPHCSVLIAPDLVAPKSSGFSSTSLRPAKRRGSLRIVCVSRVSRMKNLSFALQNLHHLDGNIEFDIFGPLEDAAYWAKCERVIASLPPNVTVRYRGSIDHQRVESVINQYHLFLLPSLGENFGHAILESLRAGCPVLISDRTPWRDLQKKQVGWDLPVDRPDLFAAALRECLDMNEHTWNTWSVSAQQLGTEQAQSLEVLQQNRALFWSAVGQPMQHSPGHRA